MEDERTRKQPSIETKDPNNSVGSKPSIAPDANGNTVITSQQGETFTIDRKAERALVWKFDLRILPLLALMYLFNALDKTNLGNAATVCSQIPSCR